MTVAIATAICTFYLKAMQRLGMVKKTSVTLDENSYLFLFKHGKKDKYIEKIIIERLNELNGLLKFLKKKFSEKEILRLIDEINLPIGKWEKKNANLPMVHKEALIALWEETIFTGIEPDELLKILKEVDD